ncbi:isoaspartyl peptidase/L-asparaginase family protein [Maricaulis sp.]|uniref:isoaspartyl peptidase/L-asparaginase family protein n=1 Tax=Maricaulis sp. TaxID=1486257 RepID=UPI0026056C1A|nr:isoaspartyl peptidase/L-asparaginase [Maricaulis sp.]
MGQTYALLLHGGAGVLAARSYDPERMHMRELAEAGKAMLESGKTALDVVTEIVRRLEASGLYVAGKGASPNQAGRYELDAAIMDGATQKAGAVAALTGFVSPVHAARAVMEKTRHVMLAGRGAERFAGLQELERVESVNDYYTPAAAPDTRDIATGTVGCVALDVSGRIAAATSTGGTLNKLEGRVGDSPILGAGCWADGHVAVSCTGQGEFFLRKATAKDVSARMAYGGQGLAEAAQGAIADIGTMGGEGGLIAVDARGNLAQPFNSPGMKRAAVYPDGRITVEVD